MMRIERSQLRGTRGFCALIWVLWPLLLLAGVEFHPAGEGLQPPVGSSSIHFDAVHAAAAPHLESSRQRPGHDCPACLHQLRAGAAVLPERPAVDPATAAIPDPVAMACAASRVAHGGASPRGPPVLA